jgi:hypothetical protein
MDQSQTGENQVQAIDEVAVARLRAARKAREETIEKAAKELRKAIGGQHVLIIGLVGMDYVVTVDADDEPEGPRAKRLKAKTLLVEHLAEITRHEYREAENEDWREEWNRAHPEANS